MEAHYNTAFLLQYRYIFTMVQATANHSLELKTNQREAEKGYRCSPSV